MFVYIIIIIICNIIFVSKYKKRIPFPIFGMIKINFNIFFVISANKPIEIQNIFHHSLCVLTPSLLYVGHHHHHHNHHHLCCHTAIHTIIIAKPPPLSLPPLSSPTILSALLPPLSPLQLPHN